MCIFADLSGKAPMAGVASMVVTYGEIKYNKLNLKDIFYSCISLKKSLSTLAGELNLYSFATLAQKVTKVVGAILNKS